MFGKATFDFLAELSVNNNRAWFDLHKSRYEALVREPAFAFIEAMAPALQTFAPAFRAEPRKVGGSLMRVYRDTRFARDKTPYKTNIGIQFRHQLGKDIHAPGFYVHISVEECFFAVGCWHPDALALGKIREHIADKPDKWFGASQDKKFISHWALGGDSLMRPPRGYAENLPAIADIKRKDFIAIAPLTMAEVTAADFVAQSEREFSLSVPFMKFLCEALQISY